MSGSFDPNKPSTSKCEVESDNLEEKKLQINIIRKKNVPKFFVSVIPTEIEIHGDLIQYTIRSITLENETEKGPKTPIVEKTVKRYWDDVEYLHHVVVNSAYPGYGLIPPPLPENPPTDEVFLDREDTIVHFSPLITKLLFDENFQRECWFLEQYLRDMLSHEVYGIDSFWERFFTVPDAPPKIKLKKTKSYLKTMFNNPDGLDQFIFSNSRNKFMYPDCDEFLENQREWIHVFQHYLKDCFDSMFMRTQARIRLCNNLEHLSTIFTLNTSTNNAQLDRKWIKLNSAISKSLVEYSNTLHLMIMNDDSTLMCNLEYWEKYLRNGKEMIYNRICLLIDADNAKKTYFNSKPGPKKDEVSKQI